MELKRYDPRDPRFGRMGRFDPSEDVCALWWSGSGLRMRVACTDMEIEAEVGGGAHRPWLAVTVDGAPIARFALMPGRRRYALLSGMDGTTAHEVAVLRDTQPTDQDPGPLRLTGVYTDGTIEPPEPRPRLVEFIGDSLTVGEGAVGPTSAQEWVMAWISNVHAYPELVARRLNAEKRVIALGGWGASVAWDGDREHRIGNIYDRLCGIVPGGEVPYDLAAQRPADAVVINLGTNDGSGIALAPEAERPGELDRLTDCAVDLMARVRKAQPEAWILWAYGLCGGGMGEPLRAAVERRSAAGDERVRYLALTDCGNDLGSRSHPGRHAHARAAGEIAKALEALWNGGDRSHPH